MTNAIKRARDFVLSGVNDAMVEALAKAETSTLESIEK
jgi:hypothetical protein